MLKNYLTTWVHNNNQIVINCRFLRLFNLSYFRKSKKKHQNQCIDFSNNSFNKASVEFKTFVII